MIKRLGSINNVGAAVFLRADWALRWRKSCSDLAVVSRGAVAASADTYAEDDEKASGLTYES